MIVLEGIEESFNNEEAEAILSLSLDKVINSYDLVRKSLYDFDLNTPEGIEKLMALLPIMDPEILKDIMTEIWPGYPTDIDARRHRLEIKGYLKDYLESQYDPENETNESNIQGYADQRTEETPASADTTATAAAEGTSNTEGAVDSPEKPEAQNQTAIAPNVST